ncbi:MAG TPA: hypothetical protein VF867_17065 [Arthrobacter sp.]|jgi:hypothetical protein
MTVMGIPAAIAATTSTDGSVNEPPHDADGNADGGPARQRGTR